MITAQNLYSIAIHLTDIEKEKLLNMLLKNSNTFSTTKCNTTPSITDKEAIDYLLKNVFLKKIKTPRKAKTS